MASQKEGLSGQRSLRASIRQGFQQGAEKTYSKLDAKGTAALEHFLAEVEQMMFLLFVSNCVLCLCIPFGHWEGIQLCLMLA